MVQLLFGGLLVVPVRGKKFYQNKDNSTLYHVLESYPKLERMVDSIPSNIKGAIIDGGANNGLFSFLAENRFPNNQILACEPSPTLQAVLKQNFDKTHVELVPKALSDVSGEVTLYTASQSDQAGSIFKSNVEVFGHKQVNSVTVSAITLHDLLIEKAIDRISVLKLDVQGAEYQILKSADDVLAKTDYLILELMFIEPAVFDLMQLVRQKFPYYKVLNKVSYGADIMFSRHDFEKSSA
jgi:FkbM family methyltransferase